MLDTSVARTSVLVVDDSGAARMIICTSLARAGILARSVKTAAEALAAIVEDRPELVLADIHMPEVDGFELLDKLREVDPQLPVLMVSGNVDSGLRRRAAQRGAAGVVTKSDNLREFVDTIRQTARPGPTQANRVIRGSR